MWYLYLDESGDLGFDFESKNSSKYFTICILAIYQRDSFKKIGGAIKKTLHQKLKKGKKVFGHELKGSRTTLDVKKYFFNKIRDCKFEIYALTVDKKRVHKVRSKQKEELYNFIVGELIDHIPFEKASERIQVAVDKCKDKSRRAEFNKYIYQRLEGRIDPKIPINIDHLSSQVDPVIQAVDLFSWGIFRKYERDDFEWYDYYKDRIVYDEQYISK